MRTGSLSERIKIQKPVASKNAYGEFMPEVWTDVKEVWAKVTPLMPGLSGVGRTETFQADQLVAHTIYQFTIHYPDFSIFETYRILWRGKYYYIRSIHEKLRDVALEIFTQKKDSFQNET
jgi:SPP1 family predicted phage head-tail adaptor